MPLSPVTEGKLGFLAPKSIERDINGSKWRFFAVRVPMVAELLSLSGPVAAALATLFSTGKDLRAIKSKEVTIRTPEGATQTTTEQESPAAPLDVVKHREAATQDAIRGLIDTLVGEKSQNILARFVMDSLRQDFVARPDQAEIDAFWNRLDLDVIAQMIAGALEANAQVIRPFLAKAGLNLRGEALDALRDRLVPGLKLVKAQSESATMPTTSVEPSSSSSPS